MMLSDFSPAFTTTKLSSTLTTSAVMTSPMRISLRVRLSSNSAANDSPAECWSGLGGGCDAGPLKKKPIQTARLGLAGSVEQQGHAFSAAPPDSLPPPAHDPLDHFVDRKCRRIEHLRIGRRNQRRDRCASLSRASRSARSRERARRLAAIPFSINCLYLPLGPHFRARLSEKILSAASGKHDGTPCRARRPPGRGRAEGALARQKRRGAPPAMRATSEARLPTASLPDMRR